MANSVNFPGTPVDYGVKIQNSDGTTPKDFIVGPTGGLMVGQIRAASDDTADVVLQFTRTVAGVDYIIGESKVPLGAGTNGSTAWKSILPDLNASEAMTLPAGTKLRVAAKTAVSSGKTIYLVADGGQF